jgi:hypothetical protein
MGSDSDAREWQVVPAYDFLQMNVRQPSIQPIAVVTGYSLRKRPF